MIKNLNKKLTFIDLFAGCGGLSLGLEQAGFYPLYVNELNSDALETYLINRDQEYPHLREKYHSKDIKEVILKKDYFDSLLNDLQVDFKRDFRENSVDLITGGPPCQGYSALGIRRSYSVDKKQLPSNHLYQDMAYFISQIQPKIFLFENVRGLLNAKWTKDGMKGEIFKDVFKTFDSLSNYTVKFKLVKANDYGVPQNRPRVLIIGIRNDFNFNSMSALDALEGGLLPEPTNDYPDIEDLLSDLVDDNFEYGGESLSYRKDPLNRLQESYRTNIHSGVLMKKGDELTEMKYSRHSDKVVEKFSHMIKNQGKIPEHLKTKKFAQRVLPKKWGDNGPKITVTSLPDDFVHYSQARSLTVREWARLQTFPDWYKFAGKRTTGGIRRAGNPRESNFEREVPRYTQIGNAVPVKLASEIGKHFRKLLQN
ncbi:DNA cytosine methyltransferase [Pseudothioglobus sp. nBUS_23]|uniref:DNA cytosine methyltransferase n=1 Tax=Pseudothioglobus sp. nBUS_23 TaxID=3395318 RepID=UPI003EBC0F42